MRKLGNVILFFLSCTICLYATNEMASIFDFHHYLEEMADKKDCQQIYYSLGANSENFNEITSFIEDDEMIESIGDIDGVKIQYPYTSITNTLKDDWTKEVTDVKVNGEKIEFDEHMPIRIVPYYPEDELDTNMKKVFVSDTIWYRLDRENDFDLPVNFEGMFYLPQFEKDDSQEHTKITYQKQWLSFELNGMIDYDYHSSLHEEGSLIYVPYTMMESLCNHQYESQIVYLDDVYEYAKVISKMNEMSDDLVHYSGREYYEDFLDNIFTSYDLPEFFLFLVITIVVVFLDFKFIFKFYPEHSRQPYIHWLIGLGLAYLFLNQSIFYRETLAIYAMVFAIVLAFVQKKKKY